MLARFLVCLFGLILIADAAAQRPPNVYAITGARIVHEAGREIAEGTIVIRDGVIEAVGADIKPPIDAFVLDGKGYIIYPGFVDAASSWGIDAAQQRSEGGPPASTDVGSDPLIATPMDQRKGITPEFQARGALKVDEEVTEAWRKRGFTARLVVPEAGIVAGQSALVSLSGAVPREALLRAPAALHLSFRTPPGSDYPRSLMGTIAHARQTFYDAGHYRYLWTVYEKAGRVGKRPPVDPALAALLPFFDRQYPVVFEADSRDEIGRALAFAKEFNLKAILLGGRDAWKVADQLVETRTPVLLRLSFSEPAKREGKAETPRRIEAERTQKREEEHACAKILHEKGILFGFCTQGVAADKWQDNLALVLKAGLPNDAALRALTAAPAKILGSESQLGTLTKGKAAHLVVLNGDWHDKDTKVHMHFSDGILHQYDAPRREKKPISEGPRGPATGPGEVDEKIRSETQADRVPKLKTNGNVHLKGATLLTVSNGTKPNCDLWIQNGKIVGIGERPISFKEGITIDARGMFIMPGIIDTHSHFGIAGGVNEFSLSVVPEVRVEDVINSEDVQIYRGLAGGVTTARLLHGSANVIGGQHAVIKLKYGQPTDKLLIADAPRGVKFALGENVKRTDGRFPNTRLGVEAVLVRAFTEAQEYRKAWDDYEKAKTKEGFNTPVPRRDLRLEALADILRGKLHVHCHCYRADEILMLLRTADRFGFKVRSLQHVLEGYKIAPEIAAHGASCSLFSDWWAYKIEAFDAIPYAAAILRQAGVDVCFKSDSNELMRHLYQEAAKAIKYGGMNADDALKLITINPARQLGLDKRLGSLDIGKDADLAIFNGHPLNGYSRVEMALIDGEVFFQRSDQLTASAPAQAKPSAPAQEFKPIALSSAGRYVLTSITVHPVVKPAFDAHVYIEKGRIQKIIAAHELPALGMDETRISAVGLHLYPGMIDAGTILGLVELGSAKETQDYDESGDFQPDLRAASGINPDSELIPVTRANGVLTVVVRPTGGILAGQSVLINLAGWTPQEMSLIDPLALHLDFPPSSTVPRFLTDPNSPNPARALAKKQREEKVRKLKELFRQALVHDAARKADATRPGNPRLEALAPYARGDKPVIILASRHEEILEALALADELKLKIILSGATDAWKVASELKKRDIPVILGPVMTMPTESHDPYDAPFCCAAKLHKAGVRFCIRSAGGSNARNLPYEAAMAASYGLPPDEALKAVTLYPAQILGVDKDLGSLEAGKRANLVLTNGDLLQPSTSVLSLFIDGKPLPPTSKHTRLYVRYLERLREVKEGKSRVGPNER